MVLALATAKLVLADDSDVDIEWNNTTGAGIAQDIDANGNIYVTGRINGTYPGQTGVGANDVLIQKFSSTGAEIWTHQFGTSANDAGLGVAFNGTNVYVVGYVEGTLPGQNGYGLYDAFIKKYDEDGNEIWTRQFGTTGNDFAYSAIVYGTDIIIAGTTAGELGGQTSIGDDDAYIRRYDSDGNILFTTQFGTEEADEGRGIAADATGIYVSGITYDGEFDGQTAIGDCDAYVAKYDLKGMSMLWVSQFGTEECDSANRLAVDSTGVYTAGIVEDALEGTEVEDAGDFVRKYDTNGNILWTKQCGGAEAHSLSVDFEMVYTVGIVYGTLPGETNYGGSDAFICAYDTNGNEEWSIQHGTANSDTAYGVRAKGPFTYVGEVDPVASIVKFTQDADGDGIYTQIDGDKNAYSYIYGDGTSSGKVNLLGDQKIWIKDALADLDGIALKVALSKGGIPADVSSCGDLVKSYLNNGDFVVVTCSSATVRVVDGIVENTFITAGGIEAVVSMNSGNSLKYDPALDEFTAAANNLDTLIVTVGGSDTPIAPGETVTIEAPVTDADGDGILDEVDFCPSTVLPDGLPTVELKPSHYADTDGDGIFEVGPGMTDSSFTLEDTAGCTCEQIVDFLPGMKKGLQKYGCPQGIMEEWSETY